MATLWISGRTALLLTIFATWSAVALLRGNWFVGLPLVLLAMLSKEEAVALPVILAWGLGRGRLGRAGPRQRAIGIIGAAAMLAVYLALRMNSGAFTPATAPSYYQIAFTPGRLLTNLLQYADRAGTIGAVTLVLFWIVARPGRLDLTPDDRRIAVFGVVWCALGFALTMFLPVRSSLYVCFPSVGVALVAGVVLQRWWTCHGVERSTRGRSPQGSCCRSCSGPSTTRATAAPSVKPSCRARPCPRSRTSPPNAARASSSRSATTRRARPSFDDAFGTIAQGAADLTVSPKIRVWIDPPPRDAALAGLQPPGRSDVTIALRDGAVVRLP